MQSRTDGSVIILPVGDQSFYTDRTRGPVNRVREDIPEATWRALVALINRRVDDNWLAREFPDPCPDGNGTAGTNQLNLADTIEALVPGLVWPLDRATAPDVGVALDLIDFVAQRIAEPIKEYYHDFFRHYELSFDVSQGRITFRRDVEQIFARTGVAYEVNAKMTVRRLGPPEARHILADFEPATGDNTLDELLRDARRRFLSYEIAEQRIGLEKLWDAFERLKTLESGANKKLQVRALLDKASGEPWRTHLEAEARELTSIGNSLQIRHFETSKRAVADEDVDYLFTRLVAFIVYLLRVTKRI